jgi:hypothetical protein
MRRLMLDLAFMIAVRTRLVLQRHCKVGVISQVNLRHIVKSSVFESSAPV